MIHALTLDPQIWCLNGNSHQFGQLQMAYDTSWRTLSHIGIFWAVSCKNIRLHKIQSFKLNEQILINISSDDS